MDLFFAYRPTIVASSTERITLRTLECPVAFRTLLHFYGRDWPLAIVPLDGDSQAVKLIQPDTLDRSGFPVRENDGFSDERRLRVPERGEDRRCVELYSCHGVPKGGRQMRDGAAVLDSKGAQVVARTGQTSVMPARRNPVAMRSAANANLHSKDLATAVDLRLRDQTHASSARAGARNSRQPDYRSPCSLEHRFWRQRHRSNHDCSRTRSRTRTHRGGHPVEFASTHLRL